MHDDEPAARGGEIAVQRGVGKSLNVVDERDAAGEVTAYRCESVNEAYLAVTGLTREELIGRTARDLLPPSPKVEGAA